MMFFFLFACAKEGSLVGVEDLDCAIVERPIWVDEVTDLGFTGDDLLSLFGDPAAFSVVYADGALGYTEEQVTFSELETAVALRVSRDGEQCEELWGAGSGEVVQVSFDVEIATASDDVTGTASVVIEASVAEAAMLRFSAGTNSGEADFSDSVWDTFFTMFPNHVGADCVGGTAWSGAVDAGAWSLLADCDDDGDGVPEFGGAWVEGTLGR
ncbi:MAG: hypothetical protein V4850_29755 [Myxococcota bacterium]